MQHQGNCGKATREREDDRSASGERQTKVKRGNRTGIDSLRRSLDRITEASIAPQPCTIDFFLKPAAHLRLALKLHQEKREVAFRISPIVRGCVVGQRFIMSLSSGVLTANGSKNDHKWKRPPAIKVVGIRRSLGGTANQPPLRAVERRLWTARPI